MKCIYKWTEIFTHLDCDATQRFAVGRHVEEHFWQTHFAGRRFCFRRVREDRCESTSERVLLCEAVMELPAGEQAKRGRRHCIVPGFCCLLFLEVMRQTPTLQTSKENGNVEVTGVRTLLLHCTRHSTTLLEQTKRGGAM